MPASDRLRRGILGDRRGATIVEFAIILLPLVVMMCGLFDLGFRQYISVQLQDALDEAARQVTIGTSTTTTALNNMVTTKIKLIASNAAVTVTPTAYDSFDHVSKPEPITTDTAPIGSYNAGDCFIDVNGNGNWDPDAGLSGTGGSDDVVLYTAQASYPAILPMYRLSGWSSTTIVTATAMMKNQPYASQKEPATICK